jgi:multidrug efflux pump subunit AcrA (membrane-fusion protein)
MNTQYKSNTEFHALQQQLDALRAENENLRNAPPPPTDNSALLAAQAELHTAQAELRDAQAQVAALQAALQQQRDSAARSRAKSHDLEAQLLQITQSLRDKVAQNRQGIRELKHNIAQNTTRRISASDLLQKLIDKDYAAIRRVVAATPVTKRQYSTAATYLHLESMGATWCVYEQNEKNIARLQPGPERTELEKKRLTVLRQMIYDLTIWFSMDNDKHTRYASAHVAAFIKAFGLVHTEPADGGQVSTDDEREPPAPLPTVAQLSLTNQPAT